MVINTKDVILFEGKKCSPQDFNDMQEAIAPLEKYAVTAPAVRKLIESLSSAYGSITDYGLVFEINSSEKEVVFRLFYMETRMDAEIHMPVKSITYRATSNSVLGTFYDSIRAIQKRIATQDKRQSIIDDWKESLK